MIRIAICDDEKNVRSYLASLIVKQGQDCQVIEYSSADDVLADKKEFDLIYLDIEMKSVDSDIDGMELAFKIRETCAVQPIIIFVTGYEKYVFDAFDANAFQYILKPVDEKKFSSVFNRAVETIKNTKNRRKHTIVIQYGSTQKTILLNDLFYAESQNHKVILHTKDGVVEYYAKLEDLEKELDGQFYRIHRGYLINLECVDSYSGTEVILTNGENLLLSKYRYADFVKAHLRYIKRGGV